MCKFLSTLAVVGVLTFLAVPSQAQASWLSQAIHAVQNQQNGYYYPQGYNYPPGYSYPPQSYPYNQPYPNYSSYPGYPNYPNSYYSPQPYGYGPTPYRSYYNNPQWQHDWQEWMRTHPNG